ncbi:MAG: muconate cycloisomerase [Thermoprotei archaeon]|nr:MAG: muconate cycloisomerase [Thermoprotei archaeon]
MAVIREVEAIVLEIPFVREFKISRGLVGAPGKPARHVYVRVVASDGEVGWGEARPMPSWMYETVESVRYSVERYLGPAIKGLSPYQVNEARERMDRALSPVVSSGAPFAKSAIDVALYDLLGKYAGLPLHALIGGKLVDRVEMAALISGATPDDVAQLAREMRGRGYRCFKLKIMGDPVADAQMVAALKEAVGDGALLWLDANQAYSSWRVAELLRRVEGVEGLICLEQPVPTYDFHGLSRVVARASVPVAVDESLFSHYDLMKLVSMGALDMVVLKVAKSGISGSLKIYHLVEAAGLGCLGSGMTESGVGFAASMHLYSTLRLAAPVDTNGPQFLSDMVVRGLEIEGPYAKVPDGPGLGVEVDERRLERYKVDKGEGD